jgi:hypothetical protein
MGTEQNPLQHMHQAVQHVHQHLGREWQRLATHVEKGIRPLQANLDTVFAQLQPLHTSFRHLVQSQSRQQPAHAMLASFAVSARRTQPPSTPSAPVS